MFSLIGIIAWLTGLENPTAVEEETNTIKGNKGSQVTATENCGERKHEQNEECEEHHSLTNPVLEADQCTTEMLSDSDRFEFLRVSDSEDWDEEIQSTAFYPLNNTGISGLDECYSEQNISTKGSLNISISVPGMGKASPEVETRKDALSELMNTPQEQLPYEEEYHRDHTTGYDVSQVQQEASSQVYNAPMQEACQSESSSSNKYKTDPQENFSQKAQPKTEYIRGSRDTYMYEDLFDWDYMEKLNDLETVFSLPNRDTFLITLRQILECVSSPYSFLLYLVENYYSSVTTGKNSMAHIALSQFQKWLDEEPFCMSKPTEMEKDRVLWIVTTRKLYLFDLCNKVFKLDSKGNEYLQRHVYYLLESKKRYKEAVTIASKLNLQPCFQPKEILLPLVILNKVQLAESYIADCHYQQRAFLSMLDKLCVMADEDLESLASDVIPTKPQNCKITQASLTKLGERLVKKFQLDPDDFPELFKTKNRNGLRYLLHQRQKDKGRSCKKWDDLIERCVGNNLTLQQSLVQLLTDYGDLVEARRWARFYQLPCDQTPCLEDSIPRPFSIENEMKENWEDEIRESVNNFSEINEGGSNERVWYNWYNSPRSFDNTRLSSSKSESPSVNEYSERQTTTYLGLEIPMERIYFVADYGSLRRCQRAVSKPGVTVGFDAEWKPQMCQAGLAQRLSILQLSLRDQVHILDVIALADKIAESSLLAFGNAVFANEKILKLGYGVESDFKALVTTLPVLEKSIKRMKRFVDLCTLSQQLFEIPVMKKKIEKKTQSLMSFGYLSEKGLSLLVQQCLGLPLDKTYQLSDWEQRPLLEKQIIYAALDARCLIDVFDVLDKWMAEEKIEIDLDECFPRLPWLFPKRSRRSKGKLGRQPKPGSSNSDLLRLNQPAAQGSPNSPQNFRVVVDNMLQGLGRYLRCCGVDVVMLANGDDHNKAAQIARREGRVILTTGTPYYTLRSQVPLGKCMCVPAGNAKEQVLAVFKHFNVSVKTSDIFSRCQVCNGNEYVQVSSILMRQAYINYYENEESENGAKPHSLPKTEAPSSPLNVDTLELQTGVKLQIAGLPESILDKVGLFYCCATCGKIFWEGGHFSRICTQFSEVLNDTQSFYDTKRGNVAPPERVTR